MSYYTQLHHESLLHIRGPDTLTFLQGQTTCDTRELEGARALPGVYCTPKGRVVCDFLLSELGEDHLALRMRQDVVENAAATFGKYIVFSKAELDTDNTQWQMLGVWGIDVRSKLQSLCDAVPDQQYCASRGDNYVLIQIDEKGQQFECYLQAESATDLYSELTSRLTEADETEWQSLQIEQGIGRIEAATIEEFIPQVINYDLTGHISFNKGCYTGQEVVARLHYRGKSKRRMHLAALPQQAAAGDPIFSDSEHSIGNVVNCAASEGGFNALIVATESCLADDLHLESIGGPVLTLKELPYSLPTNS